MEMIDITSLSPVTFHGINEAIMNYWAKEGKPPRFIAVNREQLERLSEIMGKVPIKYSGIYLKLK